MQRDVRRDVIGCDGHHPICGRRARTTRTSTSTTSSTTATDRNPAVSIHRLPRTALHLFLYNVPVTSPYLSCRRILTLDRLQGALTRMLLSALSSAAMPVPRRKRGKSVDTGGLALALSDPSNGLGHGWGGWEETEKGETRCALFFTLVVEGDTHERFINRQVCRGPDRRACTHREYRKFKLRQVCGPTIAHDT